MLMKAVIHSRHGNPEVLKVVTLERPVPRKNEVLVRVMAAGPDYGQWHLMSGKPYVMRLATGLTKPKQRVLGKDVSGVVEAVGAAVTRFKVGDAVFGAASRTFAEFTCAREDQLCLKPERLSFEEAAATAISGVTALIAVRDVAKMRLGQSVCVIGAGGGVGSWAVQLARHFGTRVGADVTAVPISKTGKNALDFHLSFYMGCIASRNQASAMVVVAIDKGYEPMLQHARSMGFVVRQVGHGQDNPAAPVQAASAAAPAAKKAPAKKAAARKSPAKKAAGKQPAVKKAPAKQAVAKKVATAVPAAKKAPAKKVTPAKEVVAKPAAAPAAKKAAVAVPAVAVKAPAAVGGGAKARPLLPDSAATFKKLTHSLRKMGDKRPTKPASLWRSLKSFVGTGATEESVEVALARLIDDGVVKVDSVKGASYPRFDAQSRSTANQV
jgi:D-arabinose 1-dehydrogenase-like Zn-dependent alcohol dehydrogenase